MLGDNGYGMYRQELTPDGLKEEFLPTYTCGHCNVVVVLNPERTRERQRCLKCGRVVCLQTALCSDFCVPIPEIAKDHGEGRVAKKLLPLAEAILSGARTLDEAARFGLKEF